LSVLALAGPQELLKYTPHAHRDYEVSRPAGPLGFAGGSFRALVAQRTRQRPL
jgi:hypothetical protein